MSKPIIYIPMQLGDKFNIAFPDGFIPEGVIDKTKCRVGITYQAFHEQRHTIVVVPTQAIIDDAKLNYPHLNLFGIDEHVDVEAIKIELASGRRFQKIVTTPDSFWKIIEGARGLNKLQWLFSKVFLYLDEYHCYATEAFREKILTPFDNDYVWKFEKRAFGSATPYPLSDPRFNEQQFYKLTYKEKFGTVQIIHDKNPIATLHYMITHADEFFQGPVFIYFNSVTQSGHMINTTGITDTAVFCRADERNLINLQAASIYYQDQPGDERYKKFNFFSRRYNEGWALRSDEKATIILLTDVHTPHTMVGIPYQGYQAIGRLEQHPQAIYHITNNYEKETMRTFETIQHNWLQNSANNVAYHNQQLELRATNGVTDDGGLKDFIKPYASFSDDGIAQVYYPKLDQVICGEWIKEHYSNKQSIAKAWEELNYNTTQRTFSLKPITRGRTSKADLYKQALERYLEWKRNPERYVYEIASAAIQADKLEFELLHQAIELLGPEKIIALNYNEQLMKQALIEISNTNAECKIRHILIKEYQLNGRYTKNSMKQRLQQLYDEHGVKKPDGSREIATAEKFKDFGLFELKECKAINEQGESKPGFEVLRLLYKLSKAA